MSCLCLYLGPNQRAEFWSIREYTHRYVQQSGKGLFPRLQGFAGKYQASSEGYSCVGWKNCWAQEGLSSCKFQMNPWKAPGLLRNIGCCAAFLITTLHYFFPADIKRTLNITDYCINSNELDHQTYLFLYKSFLLPLSFCTCFIFVKWMYKVCVTIFLHF